MKRHRNVFFTSDWHVGHKNILVYDQRPFKSLEDMHRVLVSNFNASVTPHSITYFLGDMGLCNEDMLSTLLSQLNGTKVIILGNHDRKPDAMLRLGFDVALHSASMEIAGQVVTLSHYPLLDVFRENVDGMRGATVGEHWHGESRHRNRALANRGQYHLHGHVHKSPADRIAGRQMDVGVRANNYLPVSISQVESWIARSSRE